MKKLWFVALAMFILCVLCGAAMADETIYTVTIEPGEGSGNTFTVQSKTIISQSEMVAGNYDQTKGCFYDGDGTIFYRLPTQCSFTAPDGQEFDYWLVRSSQGTVGKWSSAGVIDIASYGNLTVTVYWKEPEPPSSVMLSIPATINVNYGDTQTAFDIQVESVTFNHGAQTLLVTLWNSAFDSLDTDGTIPFTISTNDQSYGIYQNGCTILVNKKKTTLPYDCQGYINITSAAWAGAAPGTYTSTLNYDIDFRNGEEKQYGTIILTLTVPGQMYAVTVHGGTGSGEYEEGATVTITASEPEAGKQFKEWTGADGLTFTSGSAATATATFAMPASAVTLTATYEDIRYAITDDGAAQAYIYDDSFQQVFPAEAAAGTELSLWIREDATPDADTDNYFSGEFWYRATGTDDTVFLGSVTENGWSSPVTGLIMPPFDVIIGAVQAQRETLALDFSQSTSRSLPLDAWMQLQMFESENPLIRYDVASGNETLDINLDRADDLLITHPDETATDITLTLLPGCTAFGSFDFAFTGATDHYGAITFILPTPAFVAPDFTLPVSISTIEANAFEGIAAAVVDIPEGCASIGDYAFKACPNLTQIRIPASVTSIGADIFNGCTHTVFIFGTAGSEAETYCQDHNNCLFIAE